MRSVKFALISFLVALLVYILVFTLIFPLGQRLNVTYEAKYADFGMIRTETVRSSYPLASSPSLVIILVFFAFVSVPTIVAGILIGKLAKELWMKIGGLVGLTVGVFLLIHIDQISAMVYNAQGTRPGTLISFRIITPSSIMQTISDFETFVVVHILNPFPGGDYLVLLFPVVLSLLGIWIAAKVKG